jgi:hypothetical protein
VSTIQQNSNDKSDFESQISGSRALTTRIRHAIFGTETPDYYTQFSFFFALVFWFIFFLWSVLGSVVIRSRDWIMQEKQINVSQLIEDRGMELGFEPQSFIGRLEAFYAVAIFLWIIVLIGLILLWRKNWKFVYFFFIGCGLYLMLMWVMLGVGYWSKDTTLFDKTTFFFMLAHTAFYAYYLKREMIGEPLQFFGISTEDD